MKGEEMQITFHGVPIASIQPLTEGKAPDFELMNQYGEKIKLSSIKGTVILSIFPSIITSNCSQQTLHFNKKAGQYPEITILAISNDVATVQQNWCSTNQVKISMLSDAHNHFGSAYRLNIHGEPLDNRLARSVYVIKNQRIVYAQIMSEITEVPDYEAVMQAALGN